MEEQELEKRNRQYVDDMTKRAMSNNFDGLSEAEKTLLRSYQVASTEVQQVNQNIIRLRNELLRSEDSAKALLGKCGGILTSLLALKFGELNPPTAEPPKSNGKSNGKAKRARRKR